MPNNIYFRSRELTAQERSKEGAKHINMLASTAEPCDMGGWREVLVHRAGSVDVSTMNALLINHDPNQLAGTIDTKSVEGDEMTASATVMPEARMQSGVLVSEAIDTGALRGVSIGYTYGEADVSWDAETLTLTVNKWRSLEASLTPIPADARCQLRSMPFPSLEKRTAETNQPPMPKEAEAKPEVTPAAPAALQERISHMADSEKNPQDNPAVDLKAERTRAAEVANHAEALGLRASEYVGMEPEAARSKMLTDLAEQRKAEQKTVKTAPATVQVDQSDKIRDEALEGIAKGRSIHDVARRFANRSGVKGAGDWERSDTTEYVYENFGTSMKRTVEVSGNFTQVTALAAAKAIQNGFDSYTPVAPLISKEIYSGDFKAVRVGGLQLSDFAAAPGEGTAFADLTIDDGGGNSANEMRGGLLALTKEAIYNDELGLFMDKLASIGRKGPRAIDKAVMAALEAANFANATTTGALSASTLGSAYQAHAVLTGPAGEKLAIPAKRLVVPMGLWITALTITNHGGGETTRNVIADQGIIPVPGWHLTDANDWYLMCDPADACSIYVIRHPDYKVPQVFEIDAGGVAQRAFRAEFPYKAFVTNSSSNKPVGGYKVTNA